LLIVEKSNACLSRVYFDMLFNLGFLTYVGRYILTMNVKPQLSIQDYSNIRPVCDKYKQRDRVKGRLIY
jgi:hypothetical protein